MINIIVIAGTVGSFKAVKTGSGTSKFLVSVVTNDYFSGTTKENWHSIECYGDKAEYAANCCEKGVTAEITGRLFYRPETKLPYIIADRINFVPKAKQSQPNEPATQPDNGKPFRRRNY